MLKFKLEQTPKTTNGLDVLMTDEDGNLIGWFYDFETARKIVDVLNDEDNKEVKSDD